MDLLGCQEINKLYLSERNGVLHKHPEDSCLSARYHQKFELAKRICSFSIEAAGLIYTQHSSGREHSTHRHPTISWC